MRWAAHQFDEHPAPHRNLLNPAVIVVGGGLGRGLYESGRLDRSGFGERTGNCELRVSTLGADAVVTGLLQAAQRLVPEWISTRLRATG